MSQKEVALTFSINPSQYSLIENGKVMPTIPTLEKIASVFNVPLIEFFKSDDIEVVNLPLLEKVKILDSLEEEEKQALLKLIDMALTKKKMKDNLQNLANL